MLRSRFGYHGFLAGQGDAINLVLSDPERPSIPPDQTGRSLAVFPTRSRKSICCQLLDLLVDEVLTLVVPRLVAQRGRDA